MDIKQSFQKLRSRMAGGKEIVHSTVVSGVGVHHYLREDEHGKMRLHLRIEPDGHGILLANASRIYHFNPSAAHMAFEYLEGKQEDGPCGR